MYTVEVLFVVLLAGAKALFAQQPPAYNKLESDEQALDDRDRVVSTANVGASESSVAPAGVSAERAVHDTWFEVTLFFAPMLLGLLARAVDPLVELVNTAAVLCAASLVVSHVVTTSQQYIGNQQYETVSPRSAASARFRRQESCSTW